MSIWANESIVNQDWRYPDSKTYCEDLCRLRNSYPLIPPRAEQSEIQDAVMFLKNFNIAGTEEIKSEQAHSLSAAVRSLAYASLSGLPEGKNFSDFMDILLENKAIERIQHFMYSRYDDVRKVPANFLSVLPACNTKQRGERGGWDWNVVSGSTTVHYKDWKEMMPNGNDADRFDQWAATTNFSGALAWGDCGIFAAAFDQGMSAYAGRIFHKNGLFEVRQHQDSLHILKHIPSGTLAYAIFAPVRSLREGILCSSDTELLVMERCFGQKKGEEFLELAVCNPDLHPSSAAGGKEWFSTPTVTTH